MQGIKLVDSENYLCQLQTHLGDKIDLLDLDSNKRTNSSLIEGYLSLLEFFNEVELEEIARKVTEIYPDYDFLDWNKSRLEGLKARDPDLGRQVEALHFLVEEDNKQQEFYDKSAAIFQEATKFEVPISYQFAHSQPEIFGDYSILEDSDYLGVKSYHSLFYHMLRHLTDLRGNETAPEILGKAQKALKNKKILELGCGPGYFLYVLNQLGAEVCGLDNMPELEKVWKQYHKPWFMLDDVGNLPSLLANWEFDLIISKDFICDKVSGQQTKTIMEMVYNGLPEGGLVINQFFHGYIREEKYKEYIKKQGSHFLDSWETLSPLQKDIVLHSNNPSISPLELKSIGFEPWTHYRYDKGSNLTITLHKPSE